MASYLYASTINSEAKLFSKLALWVCVGALIEEIFFIVGIGNVLIPNLMDYLSFELFFIYEYLKYKGWVK